MLSGFAAPECDDATSAEAAVAPHSRTAAANAIAVCGFMNFLLTFQFGQSPS
jgi:hypothetical protein